ncbi:lipopolysaccharide biosynthesis protein [Novosphingobium soli]|uniref:Lipopolysaccharide biosynthesis protein n=1 Tax=Novosphingobium soli TaxID=574956 RepID=A0ABV6CW92_9SPHN
MHLLPGTQSKKAFELKPVSQLVRKGWGYARSSAAMVVGLRVAGAAFTYLNVVLLARWLNITDYGIFTLIISTVTLGGFVTRFGSDIAIVRFLGIYREKGEASLAEGAVRAALNFTLVASLIIAVIATVVYFAVPGLTDRPWLYAAAAFLLYPAFTQNEVLSAILRSFGVNFAALAPKDILWRGSLLVLALFGIWKGYESGTTLRLVIVGSGLVITALCAWQHVLQRRVRARFGAVSEAPAYDFKAWRASVVPLWLLLIARNLFRTADVLLVGALLSVRDAGIYFAVSRTAELLGFFLSSLNLLVGPAVSRGHAKGDTASVQHKLDQVSLFLIASTLSAELVLIVAGPWILGFMGPEFRDAYIPLLILSAGQCFNVFVGSSGVVLNMTGHEKANARILVTTLVFSLGLMALLASRYGLMGAAIASTVGMMTWNLGLWAAVRRLTPYDPSWLGVLSLIKRK